MDKIYREIEIVTPLMMGGSDPKAKPELRSAPFRGQLRYWLRALLNAADISTLKESEAELMGDTQIGSLVSLRTFYPASPQLAIVPCEILLHLPKGQRQQGFGFKEGGKFGLEIAARPLVHGGVPQQVVDAADLWLTLGGAGKRSRRGMGSLQRSDQIPTNGNELANNIQSLLSRAGISHKRIDASKSSPVSFPTSFCSDPADYPAFTPGCWLVLVCREAFPSYKDALYDFWAEHRSHEPFKDYPVAFGYIKGNLKNVEHDDPDKPRSGERRASPFHLHIARSNPGGNGKDGYHMVLTAFHAHPIPSVKSWERVRDLMAELWQKHAGALFFSDCSKKEGE